MERATGVDSLRELIENAKAIRGMPAFQEWSRQLKGQIEGRKNEGMKPLKSHDEVFAQEYMKGEVVGMLHALMQWDLMLEAAQAEMEELLKEGKDNEDHQPQQA